jgi:hypothetical protein
LKKVILLLFLFFNLNAQEIKLNLFENNISSEVDDYIKYQVPSSVTLSQKSIEKLILKTRIFAKEYLKNHQFKTIENLVRIQVETILAKMYEDEFLKDKKELLSDELLLSYYNANKVKYDGSLSYSFYVIESENNESLKKFSDNFSLENLKKHYDDISIIYYDNIYINDVPNIYKLHFSSLKVNTLSELIQVNDNYIKLVLVKTYSGLRTFEDVKESIKSYLLSKKISEIIEKEIGRITNEVN